MIAAVAFGWIVGGWIAVSALFAVAWSVYVGRHKHRDP